jgi:outer membrane protein assembly factor BamB
VWVIAAIVLAVVLAVTIPALTHGGENPAIVRAVREPHVLWATDAPGGSELTFALTPRHLLADSNGDLTFIDAATGKRLWHDSTSLTAISDAGDCDGAIFAVGTYDSSLDQLNIEDDLTHTWMSFAQLALPVHAPIVINSRDAFSAFTYHTQDTDRWRHVINSCFIVQPDVQASTAFGSNAFFYTTARNLVKTSLAGVYYWRHTISLTNVTSLAANSSVLVVYGQGGAAAFTTANGEQLWKTRAALLAVAPARGKWLARTYQAAHSGTGGLVALDIQTGSLTPVFLPGSPRNDDVTILGHRGTKSLVLATRNRAYVVTSSPELHVAQLIVRGTIEAADATRAIILEGSILKAVQWWLLPTV